MHLILNIAALICFVIAVAYPPLGMRLMAAGLACSAANVIF